MPNDKAPGVDVFPIEFPTKHWETVKQDVYVAVKYFFHIRKLMKAWNCTAITLIPKVPAQTQVKDYRPIAYCTILYKIIAKILTNRLKKGEVLLTTSYLAMNCLKAILGKAKRGIKQGDPVFPYLFVITMDYLQRDMNQLPMIKEFKADISSLTILQETFQKFSAASSLQENIDKIFAIGGDDHRKSELLLSYSGRVQLIKSVIFGMQIYWAHIFLPPKRIMKLIETICRTYMWTGTSATSRKALIARYKVCQPKAAGGLNIINMRLWNKAAILKQLWALAKKKDSLWIKRAYCYYIKQRDLDTMTTPKATAWVVRKIIDSKQALMQTNTMQGNLNAKLTMPKNEGIGDSR
ncbi:uncharacterized protein [Nicotiana tomentosiformis]|uniref:uncharacterized protein n=1 Tax=Nicotiana tomentosiformis TaxID=4098 RepID=UPI00388CEB01